MRRTLTVHFGPAAVVAAVLPGDEIPWTHEQARRWLDDQFTAMECEPRRASGKVLTADKIVAVVEALGAERLAADEVVRLDLARAATAALGRPLVSVDVDTGTVTF